MASANRSSSGQNNNVIPYDYGTSNDKKSDSSKAPRFNGKLKISLGGKPTYIVTSWV